MTFPASLSHAQLTIPYSVPPISVLTFGTGRNRSLF